jgi:hypothetical protein
VYNEDWRGVAQSGSALGSGPRGRQFKPARPDHFLLIFPNYSGLYPALPPFIRSMGVSVSTVGIIAAASPVIGIVVIMPAGIL